MRAERTIFASFKVLIHPKYIKNQNLKHFCCFISSLFLNFNHDVDGLVHFNMLSDAIFNVDTVFLRAFEMISLNGLSLSA